MFNMNGCICGLIALWEIAVFTHSALWFQDLIFCLFSRWWRWSWLIWGYYYDRSYGDVVLLWAAGWQQRADDERHVTRGRHTHTHTHTASRWRKRRITPGFNIKCIFLTTNLKFTESFLRLQNKHVRLKLQEFLSHHFRFYVI